MSGDSFPSILSVAESGTLVSLSWKLVGPPGFSLALLNLFYLFGWCERPASRSLFLVSIILSGFLNSLSVGFIRKLL